MKKIRYKERIRNNRCAHLRNNRHAVHIQKVREQRRRELHEFIVRKSGEQTLAHNTGRPVKDLALPPILSLTSAYDDTLAFLNEFRQCALQQRRVVRLDFTTLEHISPAAGLVLVAELDRWRRRFGFKPRVIDVDRWDANIRRLLEEMGFFRVLEVNNPPSSMPEDVTSPDVTFIGFRSRKEAYGEDARALRLELEEAVGAIVPNKGSLFRAVSEAMTNSLQHAYPPFMKNNARIEYRRWWMSGSYERSRKILRVLFFDQGVGIPATLPRNHKREHIHQILDRLGLARGDAAMIQTAIEIGRSATQKPHRGKGLGEIQKLVDQFAEGRLRILSGRGEYIYVSHTGVTLVKHHAPLGGTLIQWEVAL